MRGSVYKYKGEIMNRICPSEEMLSEYLCGVSSLEERTGIEAHISTCKECRELLAEADEIIKIPVPVVLVRRTASWCRKNLWLIICIASLLSSFMFPKYFLQSLAGFVLTGIKWIVDMKAVKTMIMIRETYKHSNEEKHMNTKRR